ncbi:hypothetical protein JHK82_050655 [Glycine max]|uniref:Integrase zinc-binding domain-containing protein n=1 Tax=Glycine max TaxID=3847 RepID=A0A0R0FCP8_SOYBN|nr:hypothetical protein JHK86_050509 [Glycine max]KAG4924810.1 hypothetical protein JHK87_050350 [Glycine soja]KAG4936450.1 hypothetical protein JHK85_051369 [Glycine max]KAG5091877.1 hypothetical protein JHK82_050655 [Glycine max]KAG5094976.1 hypothetical protein JHK84_050564 [Glycine max]
MPLDKEAKRLDFGKALKYTMIGGELYRRSFNRFLLKCINQVESMRLMREIHEGLCVAHISGPMMMLIRHGYYWPTITIDFY